MHKRFILRCAAAAVAVSLWALGTTARADDTSDPDEPSALGTWKWSFERDGKTTELAVKIKDEDENNELTGTFVGRDGTESPIKDGSFKDGEISFVIVRALKGREFAIQYEGVIVGETIRGKTVVDVLGEKRFRDWEAKRVAGTQGALSGAWKFALESPLGQVERTIKFKQENEKLTGTYTYERGDVEIKEGKVKGAEFSFLVAVEQNGKPMRFNFKGKQEGRKVKGTVDYDLPGDAGTLDFAGERVKKDAKKK